MPKFPTQDPSTTAVAPDQPLKSAEYELADQEADATMRPDRQPPRGNQDIDHEDVRRGEEKLDRVITK